MKQSLEKKNNRRKNKLPFTEAELLEGITPYLAHADLVAQISGKEFGETPCENYNKRNNHVV